MASVAEAPNQDALIALTQRLIAAADGYAGDQTLLAPAFVASDDELRAICERLGDTVRAVERWVKQRLGAPAAAPA